mgnify:FL=1
MGIDKPLISILMAVYEPRMDWLRQQLVSLNEQTYPNLRLYIRDDCSPTVPYEQIQSCVRDCITRFPYVITRNEKNLGSNATFELLTKEAEGDLFAYCDQDDVWLSEKLTVLQAAMERERAVLAYSDVSAVDDEGKLLARSLRELRPRLTYLEGSDLAPKLFFRNCVAGCAMLVNSNIAKRAIPFPRQTVCDHWIALLAATEGTVAFVPDQLVRYRQHKRNQTGVLAGVSDKQSYLRYKVAPLEERLTCYRQHTVPQEEIEAFARARIDGRIIMIWKYRALAPHEAEFEIAAHLLPDGLISWMLRRVK